MLLLVILLLTLFKEEIRRPANLLRHYLRSPLPRLGACGNFHNNYCIIMYYSNSNNYYPNQ